MNKPFLTIGLFTACFVQAQAIIYNAATDGTIPPVGASFVPVGSTDPLHPLAIKTVNGFTGLGVTGGPAGEEIDPGQSLTVQFASPQIITKLAIAFLFNGPEFGDLNETANLTVTVDGLGTFDVLLTAKYDNVADYLTFLDPTLFGFPGPIVNISPDIDPGGAGVWEIRNPFGNARVRSIRLAGSITSVTDPGSGTTTDYSNDFSLHSFGTVSASSGFHDISYNAARDGTSAPVGAAFVPFHYTDPFNPLALKTVNGFTGLGVGGGPAGEEIDPDQSLTVKFANPQIVTRLTVAFLFDGPEFSDLNEQARIGDGLLTADTDTTATYTIDLAGAGPVINISPAVDPGGAGVWEIRNPFGNTPVSSFTLAGSVRSVEVPPGSGNFIDYSNDFSLHSFQAVNAGPESRLCLPSAHNYLTSGGPTSVAIHDLNNDGKLDLAVAHVSGAVSVLFGNDDGTFQSPINLVTDFAASAVAVGDVNGDHNPDVVVAGINSPVVRVFPGHGDGTFGDAQVTSVPPGADGIALGDVDGNGHLDLVTTHRAFDIVCLLYGDGSGRFSPPMTYTFPGGPVAPVLRDLNRDGLLDLVFSRYQSKVVSVFFGAVFSGGGGSFQSLDNYPVDDIGGAPWPVAVGDFNGDGRLDLAVGFESFAGGNVLIMLAKSDGTFQRGDLYSSGATFSLGAGRIDHDKKLDLVVANALDSSISVLLGRGDGTFEPALNAFVGDGINSNPQSLALADLNNDRLDEIVTANLTAGGVSILLPQACNESPVARCKPVTASAGPDCTAVVSIDDGSSDPDAGDTITIVQDPPGPYPLGDTIVKLTVTDQHGAFDICTNIVTVVDTTPPSLHCPADITIDAVAPQGTAVTFTATASDNCGTVAAVCNPASGSVFPIGTTAVQCIATDGAGLQARCSFSVHVKGPSEQIDDLSAEVSASSINSTTKTRLLTVLSAAKQLLASGNIKAACGSLNDFADQIRTLQQSKKISATDANALLVDLSLIRAAAGCR